MATRSARPVHKGQVKLRHASVNGRFGGPQLASLVVDNPEHSTQQLLQRGVQSGEPSHQRSAAKQSAVSTMQVQRGAEKWQAGCCQRDHTLADTCLRHLVLCLLTQV